jgi:hypothetical protein
LLPDEQYIADDTYRTPCALLPEDASNLDEYEYMDVARARHEQMNRLLKTFKVVSNIFKREVTKHGLFMYAVANIVQLGLLCQLNVKGELTVTLHDQYEQEGTSNRLTTLFLSFEWGKTRCYREKEPEAVLRGVPVR